MSKGSEAVKNWRRKTKEFILECMGNKCVICEYAKCASALELHHLDPTKKKFSFGGIRANPKEWPVIETELKKCILVCSNCHREIENGLQDVSLLVSSYTPAIDVINQRPSSSRTNVILKECKHCNISYRAYNIHQRYCSIICRQNGTQKESANNDRKKRRY